MTFREKVERAFASRSLPTEVVPPKAYLQFDSDVEDALWFSGRDWRSLTWENWRDRYVAITYFSPEAFPYYLQSLLCLTAENPTDNLLAADGIISELDRSPTIDGWGEPFLSRFTALNLEELDCLEEWLVALCESPAYRGYGISSGGPGDRLGRAIDTVTLLQNNLRNA